MSISFPSGVKIPAFRRRRSSTLAARPAPIALPRMADQPDVAGMPDEDELVSFDVACKPLVSVPETIFSLPIVAPETYTSRNARLYSAKFHSPRKPSVPMVNESTGGTCSSEAKRDEAWRMVPSPPKVETRSTLRGRSEGDDEVDGDWLDVSVMLLSAPFTLPSE